MQKSIKEEIKYLERILSENSNSILFARLAEAYLQVDRVDDAIELCESGVRKYPAYVTGHFILGKCYLKKKLLDQAEKELKRAIMYDPKYIAAHRDYGELMAQIGWHTTCDMTFEEIIRIDPFNEKAKTRRAELKKQFFPKQDEKKPPEQENYEIKEMDNSFVDRTIQIDEEKAKAEIETDKFELGDSTQEEKIDTVAQETADEEDESMDLLEDIFRDTSIPELGTDELPPVEDNLEADIESRFKSQDTEITPFDKPSEPAPKGTSPDQQPGGFHLMEENINEGSASEIERLTEEPTDQFTIPESSRQTDSDYNLHKDSETQIESSQEKLGSLKETSTDEAMPLSELSELATSDDQLNQNIESEKQSPSTETTLSEHTDQTTKSEPMLSDHEPLKPVDLETPKDPFLGFDIEQPDEHKIADDFKSTASFQSEEKAIDKPVAPPQFESESESIPVQKIIEISQTEPGEEATEKKKEKIVTPTLGEIYAAQHQYSKAINVYELLMKKEPDNETYKQKIEYLYKKKEESENE